MSFMDDVEELERKAQSSKVSPFVLVGIVAVVLALVFLMLSQCASSLTTDSFQVEQSSSSSTENSESGTEGNQETTQESQSAPAEIVVYVTGEVNSPGVYTLSEGDRVNDAVLAAGGITKKAAVDQVNMASVLTDGQQVTVPNEKDFQGAAGSGSVSTSTSSGVDHNSGKINLNTATLEELQTLSGIGPALAQRIIDSRESEGKFTKTEDLLRVSGIGEKRFADIKDKLCV